MSENWPKMQKKKIVKGDRKKKRWKEVKTDLKYEKKNHQSSSKIG